MTTDPLAQTRFVLDVAGRQVIVDRVIVDRRVTYSIDAFEDDDGFTAPGLRALLAAIDASHTCPHCGVMSREPNDVENRYCGACHHFCDDYDEARQQGILTKQ